jgi:hypothetical protein
MRAESAPPPGAVVASPHDVADESYLYWTKQSSYGLLPHIEACCLLAMGDGETSFRWKWKLKTGSFTCCVVGDHGHAHGEFQHQAPRIKTILEHTGINILNCDLADPALGAVTHWDNLRAADWEISDRLSFGYKKVRPALLSLPTPREKIAMLVHSFEQSADTDRDTEKRLHLFTYWDMVYGPKQMSRI